MLFNKSDFPLNINKLIKEQEEKKDIGYCRECSFFCMKNERTMCSKYNMYTQPVQHCAGFIRETK